MEISGLGSNIPFMFQAGEKETMEAARQTRGDVVDIHSPELLSDEEAENVLNDTISMIGADSAAALSVHSGLSRSRVYALLGM